MSTSGNGAGTEFEVKLALELLDVVLEVSLHGGVLQNLRSVHSPHTLDVYGTPIPVHPVMTLGVVSLHLE